MHPKPVTLEVDFDYAWPVVDMRVCEMEYIGRSPAQAGGVLGWRPACLMRLVFFLVLVLLSVGCDARAASHHMNHKRLKLARTNAIEQEMLAKLGYSHPPDVRNFNTSIEQKREMLRLYRKSLEETQGQEHVLFSEEEFFAKNFYSFKESDISSPTYSTWKEDKDKIYVHLPVHIPEPEDANLETRIHSANFKLYKSHVWPEHLHRAEDWSIVDNDVRINIYQLLEPAKASGGTLKRLLDSKMVSLDGLGWVEFDIKDAVQHWVDDYRLNYGLELSCDTHQIGDMLQFVRVNTANQTNAAYRHAQDPLDELMPNTNILAQQREIVRRQKRAVHLERYDCIRGGGESRCCRYPLYVSFREMGWDWIEEPEGFWAYYCDGSCPRDYRKAHSFTGLKSLLRMLNPGAMPAPCCTATELKPLLVLHRDNNGNSAVTQFTDMIVDNCGCA